ncbi:MAG: DUF502 domain-containing protein [Planctomycetota bacterium]|nr:DUF502 domain-containing protein [Planctomycetota bacterium]
MKKIIQIFLAGIIVIVPFAITVWVIFSAGVWFDEIGKSALAPLWDRFQLHDWRKLDELHGIGAGILIVLVFLVGLATHFWIFRSLIGLVERLFQHVPGVKTIYESVRDLLKLFGRQESHRMGQTVLYSPPGEQLGMLAILTTETPAGLSEPEQQEMVAIYVPLAYMIGGPVLYVPKKHVQKLDLPVEQALKLCATGQVGFTKNAAAPTDQETKS